MYFTVYFPLPLPFSVSVSDSIIFLYSQCPHYTYVHLSSFFTLPLIQPSSPSCRLLLSL
jgi:hypothetical protein